MNKNLTMERSQNEAFQRSPPMQHPAHLSRVPSITRRPVTPLVITSNSRPANKGFEEYCKNTEQTPDHQRPAFMKQDSVTSARNSSAFTPIANNRTSLKKRTSVGGANTNTPSEELWRILRRSESFNKKSSDITFNGKSIKTPSGQWMLNFKPSATTSGAPHIVKQISQSSAGSNFGKYKNDQWCFTRPQASPFMKKITSLKPQNSSSFAEQETELKRGQDVHKQMSQISILSNVLSNLKQKRALDSLTKTDMDK